MRVTSFALLLALLSTTAGVAQTGGHIGLYADRPGLSECGLTETPYAVNNIYVAHGMLAEAEAVEFMVAHNWSAIEAGVDYGSNASLGDIYTGVSVWYRGCRPMPRVVATLAFIPIAASPPCEVIFEIVASPVLPSGQIEVVDCDSQTWFATGGQLFVNDDDINCPTWHCGLGPEAGTETTSWGRIKSLYR
jgi:hypothetical protein